MKTTETFYCGIDVSSETLDACKITPEGIIEWLQTTNDKKGYAQIITFAGKNAHFVMESTGNYHLNFSFYLAGKKLRYSIANALQIKRYIQMQMERHKTDKKDALRICQYGIDQQPDPYQMPDTLYFECKSLNSAIETLTKDITSYKNKIHALKKVGIDNHLIIKSYTKLLKEITTQMKILEQELQVKLQVWQPDLVKQVSSVVGIGKRATSILIVSTQGFKFTETYQQLISYAGLSPKEYSSGKSIRGKVRISKIGGSLLRHTLYMCALNAKATNLQCKHLFDRLVAKGKNKKLALIAVCNKLLKQVFGCVQNGTLFDRNYLQKTA
jgi:transposase